MDTNVGKYFIKNGEAVFPPDIWRIDFNEFDNIQDLTKLVVPESVDAIGPYALAVREILGSFKVQIESKAFAGNAKTKSLKVNDCCNIVFGSGAFSRNYNMETIEVSDSDITIGYRAFSENDKLRTFRANGSIIRIGSLAFSKCTRLETLDLSNSNIEEILD